MLGAQGLREHPSESRQIYLTEPRRLGGRKASNLLRIFRHSETWNLRPHVDVHVLERGLTARYLLSHSLSLSLSLSLSRARARARALARSLTCLFGHGRILE